MPKVRILTEMDLRAAVKLDLRAIDVVADAFLALAAGKAVMPPVLRMDMEANRGEVDVKTAWLPDFDNFAIKASPGFFDNPKRGLPSVNGMMTLFSATTGLVRAVLLDNGYLTDLRTAAAGALSVKLLARDEPAVLGVVGAGVQARMQAEAIALVRPLKRIKVWGRTPDRALACAAEITRRTGIEAHACADLQALARLADIIVTTTPARQPLLMADWLRPGQHITAMGSDAEHKNELDPAILACASLFATDSRAQSARLGELRPALDAGLVPADFPAVEIGALVSGIANGRRSPDDITVCCLSGTGAQDTAIANHALAAAEAAGAGVVIES
jgi:ornithine cyclodeaminase